LLSLKILISGSSGWKQTESWLPVMLTVLYSITQSSYGFGIYSTEQSLCSQITERQQISGIQTGYPQLDHTTGGFDKGEFLVVFGAAGRGKTMFLQNIIHNMAIGGRKCLIISIEMLNDEMGKRLIEMHGFAHDQDSSKELPVAFFPTDLPLSREVLREYCLHAAKESVEFIMIDHIGLLPELNRERRESYSAWTTFFARLAKELQIPIALIQHTVKLREDIQEPQLRDIAETSTTENNVDMAIAVWQEDNDREVKVKVKKNRLKGRRNAKALVYEKQLPSYKLVELQEAASILDHAKSLFSRSKPDESDELPF
jgi:replicative DNA helicase